MRTICLWAAGVTVFLGLAMALHADDLTKLTVVVKTQAGRPVDRAEVIVRWKANAKHPRRSYGKNVARQFDVRTDQEGQVEVPAIPQGNILIQVNAKGYQTYGKVFKIEEEEKAIDVLLDPPQQQYSAH